MTKIPDGWVLVPKVPTREMVSAAVRDGEGFNLLGVNEMQFAEAFRRALAAGPPPPGDPEVELGKQATGLAGATYRFIDRCDYREAMGWMKSEILRGTEQIHIIETVAGVIAGIATGAAGNIARSQMREFARRVMTLAAHVIEKDITALIDHKKADVVLHNRIRVVSGDTEQG